MLVKKIRAQVFCIRIPLLLMAILTSSARKQSPDVSITDIDDSLAFMNLKILRPFWLEFVLYC